MQSYPRVPGGLVRQLSPLLLLKKPEDSPKKKEEERSKEKQGKRSGKAENTER